MSGTQRKIQQISMLSLQIPSMFQTVRHPHRKVQLGRKIVAMENSQPSRRYAHSLSSPYLFGIDMAILRAQSVALGKGVVRSTFQQDTMYKAKLCCRSKERGLNQTWSGDSRRIFSTWQVKAQKPRRITYTPCNHSVAFDACLLQQSADPIMEQAAVSSIKKAFWKHEKH